MKILKEDLKEDKKKFIDETIKRIKSIANLGNNEEKVYFLNELWQLVVQDILDLKELEDKIAEMEEKIKG